MHESSSCFCSYQHLVSSILTIFLISLLNCVNLPPRLSRCTYSINFLHLQNVQSSFPFFPSINPSSADFIAKISQIFPFLSTSFATTAEDHLLVILQCSIIFCLDYSLLVGLPNLTLNPTTTDLFFSLQQEQSINSPLHYSG